VFRLYAKLHIQPGDTMHNLSCLQLNEWLLLCEDLGLSTREDPQKQLLMASQFENAQRRHQHGCQMSLPEFLEAFVCATVLSRPDNSEVDVPTRVEEVLTDLQSLASRDLAPSFRQALWSDPLVMKMLRRNDAALRAIFVDRGWHRIGLTLGHFEAFALEMGLVCDRYWVQPLGSAGFELSLTLEQVKEAYIDSLDMFAGGIASAMNGLSYEGVLECFARCGVALYGPLEMPKLHNFLDCILRNILLRNTIEQAANDVWLEARDGTPSSMMMDAADDTPRRAKANNRKRSVMPQKNKKQTAASVKSGRKGNSGGDEDDIGEDGGPEGTPRADESEGADLAGGADGELPAAEHSVAAPTGSADKQEAEGAAADEDPEVAEAPTDADLERPVAEDPKPTTPSKGTPAPASQKGKPQKRPDASPAKKSDASPGSANKKGAGSTLSSKKGDSVSSPKGEQPDSRRKPAARKPGAPGKSQPPPSKGSAAAGSPTPSGDGKQMSGEESQWFQPPASVRSQGSRGSKGDSSHRSQEASQR